MLWPIWGCRHDVTEPAAPNVFKDRSGTPFDPEFGTTKLLDQFLGGKFLNSPTALKDSGWGVGVWYVCALGGKGGGRGPSPVRST